MIYQLASLCLGSFVSAAPLQALQGSGQVRARVITVAECEADFSRVLHQAIADNIPEWLNVTAIENEAYSDVIVPFCERLGDQTVIETVEECVAELDKDVGQVLAGVDEFPQWLKDELQKVAKEHVLPDICTRLFGSTQQLSAAAKQAAKQLAKRSVAPPGLPGSVSVSVSEPTPLSPPAAHCVQTLEAKTAKAIDEFLAIPEWLNSTKPLLVVIAKEQLLTPFCVDVYAKSPSEDPEHPLTDEKACIASLSAQARDLLQMDWLAPWAKDEIIKVLEEHVYNDFCTELLSPEFARKMIQ